MSENETTHRVEAVCPKCRSEITSSKLVETVHTKTHPEADVAYVYYCPECGRFFKTDTHEPAEG